MTRKEYYVPKSYKDILKMEDKEERRMWLKAHIEEIITVKRRGTYDLCKLPKGKKCLRTMFVYAVKLNPDGSLKRRKARMVVDGRDQVEGFDFDVTYAPVVGIEMIRLILSIAAAQDWDVYQMDVTNAFLYADEPGDIYIEQPEGDIVGDPRVLKLKLNKSLYGTRQAPKNWYDEINGTFKKFGLTRSKVDQCLYFKISGNNLLVVLLYVDDIVITGSWKEEIKKFKEYLMSNYEIKDLGEIYHCLGFVVTRNRSKRTLMIDQEHYVEKLLQKFHMEEAKSSLIPGTIDGYKQIEVWKESKVDKRNPATLPYRELLGGLLYISIVSKT